MQRRDVLKGVALSSLVSGLLAHTVAAVAQDTPDSSAAAKALAELQQALDQLEVAFASPAWKLRTPQDFAEARRVLLHTLMHGLESWLEADPARPFFTPFINQHKKLLGDNPDARYYSAVIDDQHEYRIRGNLAGATYTSFTIELSAKSDGAGIGSSMAANKVPGVRASLCWDRSSARNAKEHNNANVLTMGGKLMTLTQCEAILRTWMTTEFAGGRHSTRVDKITAIERKHSK